VECCILAGAIATKLWMLLLPPVQKFGHGLPTELPRNSNSVDSQKGPDVPPGTVMPFQCPGGTTVPSVKKVWHPRLPQFPSVPHWPYLFRNGPAHFFCPFPVQYGAVPQQCAFLDAPTVVGETDPPVRRA
jgi:hypothetical protein